MEDSTLKDFWKSEIDNKVSNYTKDELNEILLAKARTSIRKFYPLDTLPFIAVAFLLYLVLSAVSRLHDPLFVTGNTILAVSMIATYIFKIISFSKMNRYAPDQPLKAWLKYRIDVLEKSSYSLSNQFVPPVVFILTLISVNVYIANKPYLEFLLSPEFFTALLVGTFVGVPVAYLIARKNRNNRIKNLYNLRKLYQQIDWEK